MNKFENSRKMINQYYEEMAIIAAENADQAMPAIEVDPLWDCWFDIAFMYEPECTKDAPKAIVTQEAQNAESEFDGFDFYDEPIYEPNSKDKRRMQVSRRRKNTALHKKNFGRTASIILKNFEKRGEEDMQNWSYCKKRGGMYVEDPKSLTMQADRIIKRAEKMQCFESDQQESTTENKVVSKVDNTMIEQKAAA